MDKPQTLLSRIFWFGVGGGISVALNWTIFYLTGKLWHWPDAASYALSLTVVTIVFSLWNYFINFRTSAGWRECLVRYLAAIALCYAVNYSITLTGFKHLAASGWMKYAIIAVVQIGTSGLKFLLYHFWVYPHAPRTPNPG